MPLVQIVYDEGVAQSDVSRDGGDIDERGFCGEVGLPMLHSLTDAQYYRSSLGKYSRHQKSADY